MDDLSEKEQLERIRRWWDSNGRYLIAGVVLGAAVLVGWNQWRAHEVRDALEASALYEELEAALGASDLETAQAIAGRLGADYGGTPYAAQAGLALAGAYVNQGKVEEAAAELEALLARSAEGPLATIARLRLAQLRIYQEELDAALALLDAVDAGAYRARALELRGDAHAAAGDRAAARSAYREALLAAGGQPGGSAELLQLKLQSLGSDEDTGDAAVAAGEEAG